MNVNLKRRVEVLKEIYNPRDRFFVVFVEETDASIEDAKARVLKKSGLSEAPEDCFFVILNLHGRFK